MSSGAFDLGYVAALAVANIIVAVPALLRPDEKARANAEFIESGHEDLFEQRRAWKAYGTTPETDPHRLRRAAFRLIALNLLLIAAWVGIALMGRS